MIFAILRLENVSEREEQNKTELESVMKIKRFAPRAQDEKQLRWNQGGISDGGRHRNNLKPGDLGRHVKRQVEWHVKNNKRFL